MTEAQKQKLLQEYIDGSINATNRHLLEREALDDPFLFDALEGYSSDEIQKPVEHRIPKKERPQILTYLSMAASFLLIAGIAYLFNVSSNSTSNADLTAINEEVESMNSSQDHSLVLNEPKVSHLRTIEPSVEDRKVNSKESNGKKSQAQNIDVSNNKTQTQEENRIEEDSDDEAVYVSFDDPEASPQTSPSPKEASATANNEINVSTLSEEEDLASIEIDESKTEPELNNTPTKRKKTELNQEEMVASPTVIQSRNSGIEQSKNQGLLDEDVRAEMTADTVNAENNSTSADNFRKSFPNGGMNKFQEYLDENPLDKDCSQGTITFKFLILKDGTLDEIEIIDDDALNGLSPKTYADCTREAIKLLTDYGLWETIPANRRVRRVWKYTP